MRRVVWVLLLLFAFTIPWEFSLDLGPPLGTVARVAGLLVLLAAIPAVIQTGRVRNPGAMQWLALALWLWFCCTFFWTIDAPATLRKIRGFFQVMMIVWLVWEFAEGPRDLRLLVRVFVAGCGVLAVLTLADFSSPEAVAAGQYRFAAYGQDPNDVARFLDLGFPLAGLLATRPSGWLERLLALGYLPLGLTAVVLTASRGGFIAAVVAIVGCGVLLARGHARLVWAGVGGLPALAAALWFTVPRETFERLATIPQQLSRGDLNQRLNIWHAGWHAFVRAPWFGSGAGTFVSAARLSPIDTAHNTALSISVNGGLCALFLATAILVLAVALAWRASGVLRLALVISLLVWTVTSLVGTVEENRTTWLFFAMIALAGRLAEEEPEALAACFSRSVTALQK